MADRRQTTVIARTVTRTVAPLILVSSISLLLQGHNQPGGGFIAGVLTATAFALVYVIYGRQYLQRELLGVGTPDETDLFAGVTGGYARTFAAGLALALGSGLAAVALGHPFLSQSVLFVEHVPVYGELELASALAFDLGVYLVVVGALLTVLAVVGEQ